MTDDVPSDERWVLERQMREREMALAERRLEYEVKSGGKSEGWSSPLVVAVLAAAVAAAGNAVVTYVEGHQNRALEITRVEHARIQEMLETGDPDTAAANIRFLVEVGLVTDEGLRSRLMSFLDDRAPGEGPALASAVTRARVPLSFDLIELRYLPLIGSNLGKANGCPDIAQPDQLGSGNVDAETVYRCVASFLGASEREIRDLLALAPTELLRWSFEGTAPPNWRTLVGIAREQ